VFFFCFFFLGGGSFEVISLRPNTTTCERKIDTFSAQSLSSISTTLFYHAKNVIDALLLSFLHDNYGRVYVFIRVQ
jgi:hypothetical protein